jgi:hypothetical protein
MFKINVPDNEDIINILCVTNKAKGNNLVSTLKDMGHMAFTDLPLILQLELKLVYFTPSFA